MVSLILFGSFFVLLLLNVPIGLSLGISSVAALIAENLPFSMIPSNLYSSTGKFVLLAIPFFILGGNVMEKSGISARLIDFCRTLVGYRKSGMALVCHLRLRPRHSGCSGHDPDSRYGEGWL